jgi:uncharacterized membrane protein YcjF (UPF0283 family)
MELRNLVSFMFIVASVNIFYALYSLTRMDWLNVLVPTITYLVVIFAASIVDSKSNELMRIREREEANL